MLTSQRLYSGYRMISREGVFTMNKVIYFITTLFLLVISATAAGLEPYGPFDYGPQPFSSFSRDYGLQYEKDQTEDSYILKIHLNNMSPSDIEIFPAGHGIRIRNAMSFRQENRNDRGGYSYVRSSSSFSKYIRLPRDADIDRMQKTDSEGLIVITIPKTERYYRY
ncbi:MAG: Hsp20 family protein [Gammaproteobacteria bacterium]|nr:MAG: Hsp20 family protein [Gammaproteobacteria bacterium]